MGRAEFDQVSKGFGEVLALADFTLAVEQGELITVLGPSGCGKSTLLRLTAGLESLTSGSIQLGARRIDHLPPSDRDVAMVFQNYALYPHMTVRENIEFPLRMHRVRRAERSRQTAAVADFLELGELMERRPGQLSGGQRQRVALARALVRKPALFLLDEPLSNLDARLRTSVRQYIREVQRRLRVTTLYVTHDQTEAMTLGDRVVVMNQGRIQQVDTPVTVYEQPATAFVAGFVGSPPMNLLAGEYRDGVLRVADQCLPVSGALRARLECAAQQVTIGIRPEAFVPGGGDHDALVALAAPATREVLGSETLVRAAVGADQVIVRLFGVARNIPDRLVAPTDALHFFCTASGRRIGP